MSLLSHYLQTAFGVSAAASLSSWPGAGLPSPSSAPAGSGTSSVVGFTAQAGGFSGFLTLLRQASETQSWNTQKGRFGPRSLARTACCPGCGRSAAGDGAGGLGGSRRLSGFPALTPVHPESSVTTGGEGRLTRTAAVSSVGAASLCAGMCTIDVAKQNEGRNLAAASARAACVCHASLDSPLWLHFGVLVEFDPLKWFGSSGEEMLC